ncbi:MAG: replication-associated recombination protein A [Actinomycetota bacterium]
MADDLFSAAAEDALATHAPLAARLRPRTLDDIVGQEHLLAAGMPLRTLVEADRLSSVIFWGPPGTGKTTLAQAIAAHTSKVFEQLSAVSAGVKDVRDVLERAKHRLGERGQGTILFLDEVHRFSKSQQDALLPGVESGLITLIGATTENPFFEVNPPLLSRSTLFRLNPLDVEAARALLRKGLQAEGAEADDDALAHLAGHANGDGRHVLTSLEVAVAIARARWSASTDEPQSAEETKLARPVVSLADAEAALGTKALRYGRDEHYDVISAFIKSMRGSDPDAAVYWLARMLEAGEDARFIARRIVIAASEDVGEADPMALVVAVAAAHAVEHVGLPEAQLNLAQAVVHLATAPKSNRSALAVWSARDDVRHGPSVEVPVHLRDAHYSGAQKLGHGAGYDYPHDHPEGWVPQQYLPDEISGRRYYDPSHHGFEQEIRTRMERRTNRTEHQ